MAVVTLSEGADGRTVLDYWPRADSSRFAEPPWMGEFRAQKAERDAATMLAELEPDSEPATAEQRAQRNIASTGERGRQLLGLSEPDPPPSDPEAEERAAAAIDRAPGHVQRRYFGEVVGRERDVDVDAEQRAQAALALAEELGAVQPEQREDAAT